VYLKQFNGVAAAVQHGEASITIRAAAPPIDHAARDQRAD
jgi:hypothetical protein